MNPPLLVVALAAFLIRLAPAAVINIDFSAGVLPVTQTGLAAAADPAGSPPTGTLSLAMERKTG